MPDSPPPDPVTAELAAIREDLRITAELERAGGYKEQTAALRHGTALLAIPVALLRDHRPEPVYQLALSPAGRVLCGHPESALEDDRHAEDSDGDTICLDKLMYTACAACRDDSGDLMDYEDCPVFQVIRSALLGEAGNDTA